MRTAAERFAHGVDQVHRRLEARDQPLVRVGRRRGEREDAAGVPQQAAGVPARELGEPGVAVGVEEQRLAVLPQRLVSVHARAVVAVDRLRHEGRDLAVLAGDVADQVLVPLGHVRLAEQRVLAYADLGLAGRRHLVVVDEGVDAAVVHGRDDLGAEVGRVVERRQRRVALLAGDLVPEVRGVAGTAVPVRLGRVDLVVGRLRGLLVADVVEEEELELRADERLVGDPGGLHVLLGLDGDVARVTRVAVARDGVDDVADQREGGLGRDRVDDGALDVGHEQHVGLVDLLEPAQARSRRSRCRSRAGLRPAPWAGP